MTITLETVDHYAKLAALEFDESERAAMARDLGTILGYVQKITELDLSDVTATSQILGDLRATRPDEVGESLGQSAAMASAPDRESGFFLVPKMIKR